MTKMDFHNSFEYMVPLKCSQCEHIGRNKSSNINAAKYTMDKHIMMHYVESFDWFECGDTFKVRQKLDYHIKAKHGPYIC